MLDTDDLERMLVEIMTGKEPTLRTPEADAMRVQLQRECDEIIAKGGAVEIPHEIPEMTGFRSAGGPGSGNFGHAGRPAQAGGSGGSDLHERQMTIHAAFEQAFTNHMDLDDFRRECDQKTADLHPELTPEELKRLQDQEWAVFLAQIGEPPQQ